MEAILVSLVFENLRNAESQWQTRLWLWVTSHRSATSLGRVPISKKSTMHCGSPLKMKPREPSAIVYPLSPAKLARCAGSGLDIRNNVREYSSRSSASAVGNTISPPPPAVTCRLNSNAWPSLVESLRNPSAASSGAPSVDCPSVTCRIVGGYEVGCRSHQLATVSRVLLSAARIGVPPALFGSNQIGNLVFSSTTPPAPSSIFFLRSSTRSVCSLMAWIG